MGTNFYLRFKKPGNIDDIHLGKSSAGWMFLIAGYKSPGILLDSNLYAPIPVHSMRDLMALIAKGISLGAVIVDEYNTEQDLLKFGQWVRSTRYWNSKPARNHYFYMAMQYHQVDLEDVAIDPHGWPILYGPFS